MQPDELRRLARLLLDNRLAFEERRGWAERLRELADEIEALAAERKQLATALATERLKG